MGSNPTLGTNLLAGLAEMEYAAGLNPASYASSNLAPRTNQSSARSSEEERLFYTQDVGISKFSARTNLVEAAKMSLGMAHALSASGLVPHASAASWNVTAPNLVPDSGAGQVVERHPPKLLYQIPEIEGSCSSPVRTSV